MVKDVEEFFKCLHDIEIPLLGILCLDLYPIFNWIIWYFDVYFLEIFVYFGYQPSVRCEISEDLLLFCRLSFCLVDHAFCLTEASEFQ